MPAHDTKSPLNKVARLFLRLGLTAFGGPAAHIGLMEREVVARRGWLSREQFLDLVGACNLLPGPSSTQVAMALGYNRAGWMGLVAAGACFILPASLATLALAWAYVRYGSLPQTQEILYGAKPVMVAIVAQAIWNLGRMAFRRWPLALAGLACLAAAFAGAPPIAVLLVCGGATLLAVWLRTRPKPALSLAFFPTALGAGSTAGTAAGVVGLLPLVLIFLKLGVVVWGSGYVLLAFFKADLVDRLHWVTESQLLDAVTAGQVTPGPVFATATFLGYLLHGWAGAALATAAIFLPSFLMAGLVAALAVRIRKSALAAGFLDGVNAAAVSLIAFVAIALGRAALIDGWTWAIALVSVLLLVRFKVNATWLILGGAALGLILRAVA
jgi:chromate transporter